MTIFRRKEQSHLFVGASSPQVGQRSCVMVRRCGCASACACIDSLCRLCSAVDSLSPSTRFVSLRSRLPGACRLHHSASVQAVVAKFSLTNVMFRPVPAVRDFKRLQSDPPGGISGAPSPDNLMVWNAVIFGPGKLKWLTARNVCLWRLSRRGRRRSGRPETVGGDWNERPTAARRTSENGSRAAGTTLSYTSTCKQNGVRVLTPWQPLSQPPPVAVTGLRVRPQPTRHSKTGRSASS